MAIHGTAGDDNLTGTSGNDVFSLYDGGNDTAHGLGGNDSFIFFGTFTAADTVDGGDGNDVVKLEGDYSGGVTLGATTLTSVETIALATGFTYDLTTNDANVAAGATLAIDGSRLGAGQSLFFDGSAETDGSFVISGGAGDDSTIGGALADTFNLTKGGTDTAHGSGGNDTFSMGATLTAADTIDGGTGSDTVVLAGNYAGAHALSFTNDMFTSVETVRLSAGSSYDLTLASANDLTIDGHLLGAGDTMTINASTDTQVPSIIGGRGNDVIVGGPENFFNLSAGGSDTVTGGTGNIGDTFDMGAALDPTDRLNGNGGADSLEIAGNYSGSHALVLGATTATNFIHFFIEGNRADITTNDALLSAGNTMDVHIFDTDIAIFDGSAETDGTFQIFGSATRNELTGGALNDTISIHGTRDVVEGGAGNDTIIASVLNTSDRLDGGSGANGLEIAKGTTTVFDAKTIANIQSITFDAIAVRDGTYNLTLADGNVAAGQTLAVDASHVSYKIGVVVDGSAETDGHFIFNAPTGTATFIGGALADTFNIGTKVGGNVYEGGGGGDIFNAAHAASTFVYGHVSDSTSTAYDQIAALNFSQDLIKVSGLGADPAAIDTGVHTGTLSTASFDTDLSAAIGAGQLGAGDAVLFTASAGSLSGHTFLVIDENGTAGYQSGGDLVIEVGGFSGTLTTASFS